MCVIRGTRAYALGGAVVGNPGGPENLVMTTGGVRAATCELGMSTRAMCRNRESWIGRGEEELQMGEYRAIGRG